jgi:hypothetical protein
MPDLVWGLIVAVLLIRLSYVQWRLDHGGKTAREIWRESGLDV